MTVLAQALASFFRSNFFLTYLRGVRLEPPPIEVSETAGNSPCFQCLFLVTEEDLDEDEVVLFFTGGDAYAQWMKLDGFG